MRKSLASSFWIDLVSDKQWNLITIDNDDLGVLATESLGPSDEEETRNDSWGSLLIEEDHVGEKLHESSPEKASSVMKVRLQTNANSSGIDFNECFLDVLARIMIQQHVCTDSFTRFQLFDSIETITLNDVRKEEDQQRKRILSLFSPYLGDQKSLEQVELVEMVDQNGTPIGQVPRNLVHEWNLLHRGIGLVVVKGSDAAGSIADHRELLYVHRRTDSKRIFPSLYDMFVGGVSGAGESAALTAQRELAEELGLGSPLVGESWTQEPLFVCTVCTSYNRCVVTVFSYPYQEDERVKWQPEEVSWGEFVPKQVITVAAAKSVQRLIDLGEWPGRIPTDLQERFETGIDVPDEADEMQWDFVPDGLLVWEAWLRWERDSKTTTAVNVGKEQGVESILS